MAITPFSSTGVSFNGAKASPEVAGAIHQASARTGVDFKYLVAQAGQESSFRPNAAAATSSARGLYQFIESTWLDMIRDKGAQYGLGHLAANIDAQPGAARVTDPALKRQILELRNDPSVSSVMAAEYAKGNRGTLERELGRSVGATDLYMAHFLGASGATKFLSAVAAQPDKAGAAVLPEAAAANRGAFYDKQGRALSVKQIYDSYNAKFDNTQTAAAPQTPQPAEPPPSPTALLRATLMRAITGDQLSPVTIQALMQLDVPGRISRNASVRGS